MRLRGGHDATALLPHALDAGVAYVPGAAFATDDRSRDFARLSFATLSPDRLVLAVDRLATVVRARAPQAAVA